MQTTARNRTRARTEILMGGLLSILEGESRIRNFLANEMNTTKQALVAKGKKKSNIYIYICMMPIAAF